MTLSRTRIFGWDGTFRAELSHVPSQRQWMLDDVGKGTFTISTSNDAGTGDNPNVNQRVLSPGNIVLIQHPTLPAWVGVIDLPIEWDEGEVKVTIWQAEKLLQQRSTQVDVNLKNSAGNMFLKILAEANKSVALYGGTEIVTGNVYTGSTTYEETLGDQAFKHIQDVAQKSNEDFDVTYQLSPSENLITLYGNWYKNKGTTMNQSLKQGLNIKYGNPILQWNPDIQNVITGLGDTTGKGTRNKAIEFNNASCVAYGARSYNNVVTGVTGVSAIDNSTIKLLEKNGTGVYVFNPTVINVGNIFSSLAIGNVLPVNLTHAGFYGNGLGFSQNMKITSMTYDDISDTADLTMVTYVP